MRSTLLSLSHTVGVGASNFVGVQRIFAQIVLNLPKKLLCNFADRFFGVTSKLGRHFAQIFRDFA